MWQHLYVKQCINIKHWLICSVKKGKTFVNKGSAILWTLVSFSICNRLTSSLGSGWRGRGLLGRIHVKMYLQSCLPDWTQGSLQNQIIKAQIVPENWNILTNVKLRWKLDRRRAGCSNELLKMVEKLKRLLQATLVPLSSDAFLSIFPITLVVVQNIRRKNKILREKKKEKHWKRGWKTSLLQMQLLSRYLQPLFFQSPHTKSWNGMWNSLFFKKHQVFSLSKKLIYILPWIGPFPFSLLSRKTRL